MVRAFSPRALWPVRRDAEFAHVRQMISCPTLSRGQWPTSLPQRLHSARKVLERGPCDGQPFGAALPRSCRQEQPGRGRRSARCGNCRDCRAGRRQVAQRPCALLALWAKAVGGLMSSQAVGSSMSLIVSPSHPVPQRLVPIELSPLAVLVLGVRSPSLERRNLVAEGSRAATDRPWLEAGRAGVRDGASLQEAGDSRASRASLAHMGWD
jgi:hypothetical protein